MAKSSKLEQALTDTEASSEEAKVETKGTPRVRMTREERKKILNQGKQFIDEKYFDRGNFVYRLCNENVGLVEYREKLGYEVVRDENGDPIRKVANKGKEATCSHAILMRIPKEDYAEIQSIKQEKTDAQIESIEPNAAKGQYGSGLRDVK